MPDLSLIPEAAWREAQRRAEVVRPLAERPRRSRHLVRAATASLSLSERQTYELLRRCREAGGELTALLPSRSGGGRGGMRLQTASEALLRWVVEESYLTAQRRPARSGPTGRSCSATAASPPPGVIAPVHPQGQEIPAR